MSSAAREFVAVIRETAAGSFAAQFPDLPGCSGSGSTEDEAIDVAPGTLANHLQNMTQNGEPIPTPSTFREISANSIWRGALVIRVEAGVYVANRPEAL
jgi:predicted RNase H-like HicB family nuclease